MRTVHPDVMQARHRAERETDNADAVFQRMLAEPAHARMALRPALAFSTYLRRFDEHVLGLAAALAGQTLPASAEVAGTKLLAKLDDIAASLAGIPRGSMQGAIPAAAEAAPDEAGTLRAWLLRLEVDAAALQAAADSIMSGYRRAKPPAPPTAVGIETSHALMARCFERLMPSGSRTSMRARFRGAAGIVFAELPR